MQRDDRLGCNVCKICSENIMKFYNFVSTYKKSDKKLRSMLKNATVPVDEIMELKPDIVNITDQHQQVNYLSEFKEMVVLVKPENSVDDGDTKEFVSKIPIADPISVKWQCSVCLSNFKTHRLLKIHRRKHKSRKSDAKSLTNRKLAHCAICLDRFPSHNLLEKHRQELHLQLQETHKSDEFECDICRKTFNSRNKIRQHLITHINEGRRKFLCVACGNQFCTKFGLTQHIRAIHDKEQRFQCTKCNRRFAHKHNLKTHLNRHDGIRPYACKVCTKTFYDSSTLNVHTKSVHSDTNAYVCNICSKAFNRNGNLKLHMAKTHQIQQQKRQGSVGSIQRVKVIVE